MKIVLDLSRLLEQGKLTPEEAERLRALAAADTGAFAISLLVGFGVIAVSAGAVALVPRPETALMLGVAMFAIGHGFTLQGKERWSLLAQICRRGRRADVFRRCAHNRQRRACRDADRRGRARGSFHRRTVELAYGCGGARARRLSRRSLWLLARHLYARHLRAAGHDRSFQSSRARHVLSLASRSLQTTSAWR